MTKYEYRVIPAPTKAKRGRWVRSAAAKFADRLEQIFNEMGEEGWDYVRTDTLPNEERTGLTQKTITYRNLLVFKRAVAEVAAPPQLEDQAQQPKLLEAPVAEAPTPAPAPAQSPPIFSTKKGQRRRKGEDLGALIIENEKTSSGPPTPVVVPQPILSNDAYPEDVSSSEALAAAFFAKPVKDVDQGT